MNCQILATEVAKEEYKDLSDQAVADALNAATITAVRNVPTVEIATWAAENGVMAGLFALERSPETPTPLYGVIKTLLTILERLTEWRILTDGGEPTGAAAAMMAGLIQAGVMTDEQAGELMAMAMEQTSRAVQLGLQTVLASDVQRARGGVW